MAVEATGSQKVTYQGQEIDFENFREFSMREAVVEFWQGEQKPTMDDVKSGQWLASHSREQSAGCGIWWICLNVMWNRS